ncbi:MAG: glucosylceramidase [Phycisphaeraceae bacterium]|nr:glucosylceramidase [Phycisphaeraceae bacterium]
MKPDLFDQAQLFDRGRRRVYREDNLSAISLPLGGIAAGPIQINGQARRHKWQIFQNYRAISLPNSFFAVRCKASSASPVIRAMQTVAEGPFSHMKALRFSGEYPFGWYAFDDPELPVRLELEAFSPLVPLNEKDSAIPGAIFNVTASNESNSRIEVGFLATQQNAIGIRTGEERIEGRRCAAYQGNANRVIRNGKATMLHMTTTLPKDSANYGDMVLATTAQDAQGCAAWSDLSSLYETFAATGRIPVLDQTNPAPSGTTHDGALSVQFMLEPGQTQTVTFILAWHFPNTSPVEGHQGNQYANWWPDALSVASDVISRQRELTSQTQLYNQTFYASNLPHWLLDRISSQVAILRSMTCNWDARGFFYAWEGCHPAEGCCTGNATHVWGYAQAHARLFPALGRTMREEDIQNVRPDGMLPVRFTFKYPAFDGQCSFVLSCFREHLLCRDNTWLARHWPTIKRAMDYLIIRWNVAGTTTDEACLQAGIPDGMLTGPQHGMDGDQSGTSSWMGSMYLAALAVAEQMARCQRDTASADFYRQIRENGGRNQDQQLFNGEYFIQIPDTPPLQDYLTGCYIDQLLGQWWVRQLGGGWLYPKEHVLTAMRSLFGYNFRPNFRDIPQLPRKFVDDADAGLVQCAWPRGGRPGSHQINEIGYADEVMSGFEYAAAALMIQTGLLDEAFTVLYAAANRYDGRLRTGLTGCEQPPRSWDAWGYSGNPFGDDECGKFYARAMSIWSVLLACQGFEYDGPASRIGFAPIWRPQDHVSFFTAGEGWGLFTQQRDDHTQRETIAVRWGQLRLRTLTFVLPADVQSRNATVTVNGQAIDSSHVNTTNHVTITLATETCLQTGQQVEVMLTIN